MIIFFCKIVKIAPKNMDRIYKMRALITTECRATFLAIVIKVARWLTSRRRANESYTFLVL